MGDRRFPAKEEGLEAKFKPSRTARYCGTLYTTRPEDYQHAQPSLGGPAHTEQQSSDEDTRSGLSGSGSVAWGDCNGDGWLDVYNGNLYMNAGDGTFALFTDPAGITIAGGSGMWGDYDNDGNLDLFVAQNNDQLYRGAGECMPIRATVEAAIPTDTVEEAVEELSGRVPTGSSSSGSKSRGGRVGSCPLFWWVSLPAGSSPCRCSSSSPRSRSAA